MPLYLTTWCFLSIHLGVNYDKNNQSGGYAHIWELRQNQLDEANQQIKVSSHPDHLVGIPPGRFTDPHQHRGGGGGLARVHKDHVYESPKGGRHGEELCYPPNDAPFYHEFDPNLDHITELSHLTEGQHPRRHDNIRSRMDASSLDCNISLHDD